MAQAANGQCRLFFDCSASILVYCDSQQVQLATAMGTEFSGSRGHTSGGARLRERYDRVSEPLGRVPRLLLLHALIIALPCVACLFVFLSQMPHARCVDALGPHEAPSQLPPLSSSTLRCLHPRQSPR